MPSYLTTTADLAGDTIFQSRVQAAMTSAAITVASEAVGTQSIGSYTLRHALAVNILQNTMGPNGGFVPAGSVAWLDQFTWAVAANATIAAELGQLIGITSSSSASPPVVLTPSAHGLSTGNYVCINGMTGNVLINGTWPVTVIDTTHFTVPAPSGTAGSGGQMNQVPSDTDLQTAVASAFGAVAGVGIQT